MRKNVMLSLLAMTSASMTAYANADLTDQIKTDVKDWTSDTNVKLENGIFVSPNGTAIKQEIKLVPGEYTLKVETNENATVSVTGASYNASTGKITVKGIKEVGVTITATATDKGKQFRVGGFSLILAYDFAATKATLTANLDAAKAKYANYSSDKNNFDVFTAKAADIERLINTIKDDSQVANEEDYEAYRGLMLYLGIENIQITKNTNTLNSEATAYAAAFDAYNKQKEALAAVKTELDKTETSEYAKKKYTPTYTTINGKIEAFKATIDASTKAGTAEKDLTAAVVTEFNKVADEIAPIITNIGTANANDAAYKAVVDAIDAAALVSADNADKVNVALAGDIYKDMRDSTIAKLSAVYAEAVRKAKELNGSNESHDNADKNKVASLKFITDATASQTAIVDAAIANTEKLTAAFTEATKAIAALKKSSADFATFVKKVIDVTVADGKTYKEEIAAIDARITALEGDINAANVAHTIKLETYSEENAAIAKAISDLKTKATPVVANKDAYDNTVVGIADLQKEFDTAKAVVDKLVSKDKLYNVTGGKYYERTEAAITKVITTSTTDAAKAFKEGKAVAYYETFKASSATATTAIEKYSKDTKAGLDAYEAAIAAVADYTGKYNALVKVIDNPAVTDANSETYETKLASVNARITKISKATSDALKPAETDDAHTKALTSIDLDEAILTTITSLTESYSKDKVRYDGEVTVATAAKMFADATAHVGRFQKELEGLKYDAETVGLEYDKTIKKLFDDISKEVKLQADSIAAAGKEADPNKTIKAITAAEKALDLLQNRITDMKAKADVAIDRVKANEATEKTATDEIAKLNVNVIGDGKTVKAIIALNTDPSKTEEFKTLATELTNAIKEQSDAVNAARAKETLPAEYDKEKGIKSALAAIGKDVDDARTAATAATKNYDAYQSFVKAKDGYLDKSNIQANITAAITNVKKLGSTETGTKHFVDVVLAGYQKELDAINKNIKADYEAGKSVSTKTAIEKSIDALNTKVNGVEALAKANKDAYDKQTKSFQETSTIWAKVYGEINATDQSSLRDGYLKDLADLKTQLNTLKSNTDSLYAIGESKVKDNIKEYTDIKAKIQDISDKQNKDYNAAIKQDNDDRYNTFYNYVVEDVKGTEKTYTSATATIAKYNNLTNPGYKDKVAPIIAEANQTIYAYSVKIDELKKKALKDYEATKSPALYDADEDYLATAKTYTTDIEDALAKFRADVKTLTDAIYATEVRKVNDQLTEAKTKLSDASCSNKTIEAAFSDVRKIIADADALYASDKDFALSLDGVLDEFATVEGLLAAGYEPAAVADWTSKIAAANAQDKKWSDALKGFEYMQTETRDFTNLYTDKVKKTKAVAETTANAAITAKNLFGDNLIAVNALLGRFNSEAGAIYNDAKAANDANNVNDAAYAEVTETLTSVSAKLAAARAFTEAYYGAYLTRPTINDLQDSINTHKDNADRFLTEGLSNQKKQAIIDNCKDVLVPGINAIYSQATTNESKALAGDNGAIAILRTAYNTAAEKIGVTNPDLLAINARIELLEDKVTGVQNFARAVETPQQKQKKLLAIEKEMSDIYNDIAKLYDPNLATTTLAKLNGDVDEVIADYNAEVVVLSSCNEKYIQKVYAADLTNIKTSADVLKDSISAKFTATSLLFFNRNISNDITALATTLKDLTTTIAKAQEPYTANEEAYVRLTAEIKALEDRRDAVIKVIEEDYDYANIEWYTNFTEDYITHTIEISRISVENMYNATTPDDLLNAGTTLPNSGNITSNINYMENLAADNEADNRNRVLIDSLRNAVEIFDLKKHTPEASKSFEDIFNSIYGSNGIYGTDGALAYIDNYRTDAYDGRISQDIDGNKFFDEAGDPTSKPIEFMKEAIPTIFAKIEEVKGKIEDLKTFAEESGYLLGDVDRDSKVLVTDYNAILDYVLGVKTTEYESIVFLAVDANEDKKINIGDVTKSVNLIMNPNAAKSHAFRVAPVQSNDAVMLSAEGESTTKRIAINLNNTLAYVGCQMDIKLPAGMTLMGESLSSRANGHVLYSNDLANGMHRIVVSSVENNELTNSESAVVYLDVEMGKRSAGDIEVSNIMFTDADARIYNFADITSGSVTGIHNATDDESLSSKIYSVGGRVLNAIKKGVNIIRKSDGSTTKVIGK